MSYSQDKSDWGQVGIFIDAGCIFPQLNMKKHGAYVEWVDMPMVGSQTSRPKIVKFVRQLTMIEESEIK
jgi:hypothetical protein